MFAVTTCLISSLSIFSPVLIFILVYICIFCLCILILAILLSLFSVFGFIVITVLPLSVIENSLLMCTCLSNFFVIDLLFSCGCHAFHVL